MRFIFTTLVLFLVFFVNASCQSGTVKGKVSDRSTGEPLGGVYVIYSRNLGVTTGDDGTYSITGISGKMFFTFQFIGYETLTREVHVNDNETVELNIDLETRVREIDQVVVSANRIEQRIAELSVSMDIIKSSFLEDNHITDAQEIINKTQGIEVMDGQASVRGGSGFSYGAGSRVLALIDGLPMVSADAGNIKWQFLPLENISQIEIIKGASSVLYGSSAMNGIINFRTGDATNTPVTNFFTEAGILGKPKNENWIWWDTPRVFSSTSFSHLQKIGSNDFGISANLFLDEGYRRLNGEKLVRINLKLKHFNKNIQGLTYGLNLNSGYTDKRDFVLWEDADSGALKQDVKTAAELHGDFLDVDPFISYKKSNRFQHDLRLRAQSSRNRLPDNQENNSDAISLYSEYQLWYRLFEFLDLTAGVSENYIHVNSNFFNDHHGINIAGFTQFEIRPLARLKAVAGLRVEHYSLDNKNDKVVPIIRAGLNWQAADYTFLRASFGQGYRYPSIAEKFAATTLGSIRIIANPSIVSESGWNTEAGIKQGISFGKMTGQADLSFFFMQNSNLIEYKFGFYPEGLGFRAANNANDARIYGAELEFLLYRSSGRINTTFSGGYTFMYPVEYDNDIHKNTDTYLNYRRMHSGNLGTVITWKKLDAGLDIYFKSKILNIDSVFLDTQILPGFDDYWPEHNKACGVLDVKAGYKLTEKLTLSVAVKNLTNTEYMGRPGDIQPQRNYSIRVSARF
jgi:outer membrane receptor protein involved in Fe transport